MGLSAASFLSREYLCILRRCAWYNAFNYFVAVSSAFYGVSAMADQITIDGRTQTELSISGSITDITTQTIQGVNALNSFHRFNIGGGQTVNLYLPTGTANLLNLVHDERSQLDGVMNAYKDGSIGGNVFFLNPHGIVVGAEGSINVGSLTMATPTPQFMDSLVAATGQVNENVVDNVLSGKIPLTESGLIRVKGRINAVDQINLSAGQVAVDAGAHLIAGMQAQVAFGDLVNVEGIEVGSEVKIENGVISILAAGDVDIAGQIAADGIEGQNAGLVNIQAGKDIHLTTGADVSASGQGLDSSGGVVISYAQGDATLDSGAVVAANSGVSGDGGFVEFSAKKTVHINGGKLEAHANDGLGGEILIDPENVTWTGAGQDVFSDGADITIVADESIIFDDVTLSSRDVAASDNNRTNIETAVSEGDSGNISLTAKHIELLNDSKLVAHADGAYQSGAVNLAAYELDMLGTDRTANASVLLRNAFISGGRIEISSIAKTSMMTSLLEGNSSLTAEDLQSQLNTELDDPVDGIGGVFLEVKTSANAKTEILGSSIHASDDIVIESSAGARTGFEKTAVAEVFIGDAGSAIPGQPGRETNLVADNVVINSSSNTSLNFLGSTLSLLDQSWLPDPESGGVEILDDSLFDMNGVPLVSLSTSKAKTTITDNTYIEATNDINVGSNSESVAKPSFSSPLLFAMAWGESEAEALTSVAGGSDLLAGNKVSVTADTSVEIEVIAEVNSVNKPIDATFVMTKNQVTTSAVVGENTSIESGEIDILASTAQEVSAAAISKNTGGSGVGIAVAINESTSTTIATLGGDVTARSGDINVSTIVDVEKNDASASAATLGNSTSYSTQITNFQSGIKRNVAGSILSAIGGSAGANADSITSFLFPGIKEGKFNLSGAVAYTDSNNTAMASIAPNAIIKAEGALNVVSKITDRPSASVAAKSSSTGTAIGGSAVIASFTNNSNAYIGDQATVDVKKSINIDAQTYVPYPWQIDWQSPKEIYDHLTGDILDLALTSYAINSASGKDGVGLAAAVSLFNIDNNSNAYIGNGAQINSNYDQASLPLDDLSQQSVNIYAKNDVNMVNAVGILSKKFLASSGGKAGIGGAASIIGISGEAIAGIHDDASVQAAESVSVKAETINQTVSVTEAGGKSDQIGIQGAFTMNTVSSRTEAYIDDKADVSTGKNIDIEANSILENISVAGGVVATKGPVGIGMSVSLNNVSSDVKAYIGNHDSVGDTAPSSGVINAGQNLNITAVAETEFGSYSIVGALATESSAQTDVPADASETQDGSSSAVGATDAGKGKFGIAVSGDVSLNNVEANTLAYLSDGVTVAHADDVTLNATNDLALNALSGAVTVSTQSKGNGLSGSYAQNNLSGNTSSYISDASIDMTGELSVVAGVTGNIKTLSASVAATKGKVGVAGSVSINDITNKTLAYVQNSSVLGGSNAYIYAHDHSGIQSVAGAVAFGGKAGLGLSFALNTQNNSTLAYADDSDLEFSNLVNVSAETDSDTDTISAAIGASKEGMAGAASVSINKIENETRSYISGKKTILGVDAGSDISVRAQDDSHIFSISGSVGAGEVGVGASVALSQVSNTVESNISNGAVVDNIAGNININSISNSDIQAIAAAGGLANKVGISGSFSAVETSNKLLSHVSSLAEVNSAENITVSAEDNSNIENISGSIALSTGQAALGAAAAYNVIQNRVEAKLDNAQLTANNVSINAIEAASIQGLAAAGGVANNGAVSGSLVINDIDNMTVASIENSAGVYTLEDVSVSSEDISEISSLSGSASGSGTVALGIAGAYNNIGGTTSSSISGGDVTARSVLVNSKRDADIETIAVAGAVSGQAGIAGSVAINSLGGITQSYINNGSSVVAQNNVGVLADSNDQLTLAAGSIGVGISGAGIGASFAINNLKGSTEAYIVGSLTEVTALAKDSSDALNVYSGALSSAVDLGTQIDLASYNKLELQNLKETENVNGLAIHASSSEHIENITANVSGGGYLGIGSVNSINVIAGETNAYLEDASINTDNTGAGSNQNVSINASNVSYANSFVGGIVVGGGAGGQGADIHTLSRTTSAYANDGTLNTLNDFTVKALSTQGVSSIAVGGALGGLAAAGTLSMATFKNTTSAGVDGTKILATDLAVNADNQNNMYLTAGAITVGGNAAGGAFAVGSSESVTTATIENLSGTNRTDVSGSINVEANNETDIHHIVVSGAGGGGVGVAGMADINLVTDTTQARVLNSDIGSLSDKAGSLHVVASHTIDIDSKAGALGVGVTGAGIGSGASVNIVKANTTAAITDSNVYTSNETMVSAKSTKHVDATALTAGVGGTFGIGGSAVVTLIGDDLSAEAEGEVNKDGTGTLSSVDVFTSSDHFTGLDNTGNESLLSTADKNDLNATTNKSTTDVTGSAGGYVFKTAAEINGTNTINSGSLDVIAMDKTDTKTLVGGFGASFGVGAGVGGGVAVTNVKANVAANVSGTDLSTNGNINVQATADNDVGKTIEVLALAGGAGLVGLGAAVSYVDITNHVDANLASGANAGSGAVTVSAEDKTDIESDAKGAAVGAAAAGVVISNAEKNSTINASVGGVITAGSATIFAADEGLVKAIGQSAVGGLGIGIGGAIVDASDVSNVNALTADNTTFNLSGGTLNLTATGTPQTSARADGVAVSAGLGIGASMAHADSSATIKATMGSNNTVTASELNIKAIRALNISGAPSSFAKAFGASGGLLLGANATVAEAFSGGSTMASVGSDSTLSVSGTTTVKGESESQQTSSGLGFSGGIVAIGSDYSEAKSSTYTSAVLGSNVKVTGARLDVLASSEDTNYAYGVAGSGGAISAPFSEAKTINESQTYASTGSGNNTPGNERKIDVTSLNIAAKHDAHFDSWMESTNASLLGASGAKATNTVVTTSGAYIGSGGYVEADNITLDATNIVLKAGPASIPGLSDSVPTWNVNSSSGGLADVPAAGSNTTIATHALVQVGDDAHLEQTGLQSAPGVFTLNALNNVTATDKVKMSSGGLVSAASGESSILADINEATVHVGDNSVTTGTGDIAMGARSNADISTQTAVDVYGLVGVAPAGDSVSSFHSNNTINIGAASIESLNDIKLSAGANTAGQTNDMRTTARSDVYNNTVIPANRDPIADAIIGSHSQINIASGADLGAVRHIALFAEEGSATASGIGIGKDIYREALAKVASAVSNAFGGGDVSFETKTGNSITSQTSDVTVNGEVHVGIHRKQLLEIGFDGLATSQTDGISITNTDFKAVAEDILNRIETLNELIRKYTVEDADADASIAVAAYESEIKFLERKLQDINPSADVGGGFSGVADISAMQAAESSVVGMTQTRDAYVVTKNQLTSDNTTLTTDNTTLTTTNGTLQAQIAALDPTDDAAAIAVKQATIDSNALTISSNTSTINTNDGLISDLNAKITPLETTILATQTDIDNNVYSTTIIGGPIAKILTVSDAVAQLGNIYVRADELQGNGSLDAPGDAEIKIVNNGSSFLKLNDLIIPPDEGGKIYLNSIDVNDNTEINGVNGTAGADFTIFTADSQIDSAGNAVTPGKPQILIESKYDPLNPFYIALTPAGTPTLAPDIIMQGEISNLRGLVKVDSAAGSIRVEETANIRAGTVDIKTKNGDFVQSYAETIFHVNGAPLTTTPGDPLLAFPGNVDSIVRTPELAGGGIVANGSVLISARYLNVNGNIQSGIPEWGVKIPGAATVKIGTTSGTFAQAQTTYNALTVAQKEVLGSEFYAVDGATVAGLAGSQQGDWEKIDVYYNAKENRLELGGVQVQGGYIELFGEIFNTNSSSSTDIAQNIGGKLRVLDGYGQINVDNQTNLALWVNLLDTGRGVQGEINISNITGLDANNAPIITTQTFTRNSGDARTGQTYSPTAGLSYSMMVGYDSMITDYYRYSQNGWFGITEAPVLDQYKIDSITTDNDPLSRAEFLQNTPGLDVTNEVTETTNTSAAPAVAGDSWKDCNWWTACANATYYQEYTVARGDKTTKTQSVKGDNPINIEFIGFDNGTVNVASTGSVVFNSAVNNRDGDINVNSGGSITQNGDLAIMNGNNISLTSVTGMGEASQSLLLNVNSGGKLDATSTSGELHLTQVVGDLQVGSIGGVGVSKVILEAERSLLGVDANSKVQAQRVELLARNGGIGELSSSVDSQFKVITGYTTDQSQWSDKGLIATARDNVNVINTEDASNASIYSGNLLLISAESLAGDVHIETTGKAIDNNPFATTDTRTQTELANLWDSMALRGTLAEDKADEAVASYARGQENNYKLYWQLRSLQADGGASYDATFEYQLSQPQTDAMIASGMTTAQIEEFADSRTTQYRQLNEQVGGFTTVFDDGYSYDVASIESNIREGSSWTDAQLQLSVGSGLLKNITDTVTTIKTPNVKGNNISLIAGTDIGSFDDALTIDLTAPLTSLTIEQKAALAAAERDDVTVSGNILSIIQARPVNVTTGSGSLNADANGLMLIGSEEDLRINQVTTTGDIRIKTAGALINAASAGVVNVEGLNMILEAANGGIGSDTAPLLVDAEFGSGVTARAKNDIWLKSLYDFNIDTMYSPNNINIDAQGSIFDFQTTEVLNNEDLNIRGNYVMLTAQNGSIGTAVNALDVSVNKNGLISADASTPGQGVYLNGTHNENFRVGSVTSGNEVILTSADDVVLAEGTVTSVNKIKLEAGTDGTGSVDIKKEYNDGYVIDAPTTLEVIAASDIAVSGRIYAQDNVNFDAGDDITFAGGSITSTGNVNLESGSDGSGSINIEFSNPDLNTIETTETLVLTAADDINVNGNIQADSGLEFNAGHATNLTGGSISTDKVVTIASNDTLTIGGAVFGGAGVAITTPNNVEFSGGSLTSDNGINIEAGTDGSGSILGSSTGGTDIVALGTLDLQAVNRIGGENALVTEVSNQANFRSADINVEVSSRPLDNPLLLSVSDIGGGPSNNVEMKVNSNSSVTFDTFNVGVAHVTADTPSLQVPNGEITNYAVFNMPLYNTRFDTLNQDDHPGYDVNAYTLSGDFSLNALADSVTVGAFVLQQNPDLEWIGKKPENVEDKVQTILQPTQAGTGSETNNPQGINMQSSGYSMFQKPYIDGSLVDVSLNWFSPKSSSTQQDSEDKKEIEN